MNAPVKPRRLRQRSIRIGDRQIIAQGLEPDFWRDHSHKAMTVSWPVFIGVTALGFVLINALFAVAYLAGQAPISNMAQDSFPYYFYFCVETLATVGYGDMHPQSHYGHVIASIESFTGIFLIALMTGLIFARFSRPQARILFARLATVSTHNGQPAFMLRLANERHNSISDATAKLWFLRRQMTSEGRSFRGFVELPLLRNENPAFMLSWSLFHVIDEKSPMFGLSADDLETMEASFTLTINGLDENSAQIVHARQAYTFRDVVWNHHYVDILETGNGFVTLDYRKFHLTEPENIAGL